MRTNRRVQSAEVRFGPALKALAICLLIGGTAVGYVSQRHRLRQLEDRYVKLGEALHQLRAQNTKYRQDLAVLQTPERLQQKLREHRLPLAPPQPGQVVVLPAALRSVPVAVELPDGGVPAPAQQWVRR